MRHFVPSCSLTITSVVVSMCTTPTNSCFVSSEKTDTPSPLANTSGPYNRRERSTRAGSSVVAAMDRHFAAVAFQSRYTARMSDWMSAAGSWMVMAGGTSPVEGAGMVADAAPASPVASSPLDLDRRARWRRWLSAAVVGGERGEVVVCGER